MSHHTAIQVKDDEIPEDLAGPVEVPEARSTSRNVAPLVPPAQVVRADSTDSTPEGKQMPGRGESMSDSRPIFYKESGPAPAPLDLPVGVTRSMGTNGSFNNQYPNASEVSESLKSRLSEMTWCFFALIVNCLLFYLNYALIGGFNIPLDTSISASICCVILELVLILTNIITQKALDSGAAAYIGHKFAEKKGYSLAACGFIQSNSLIERATFAGQLSLNSTCRVFLSRMSLIWITLNLLLVLSPITATAMYSSSARINSGTVECIIFEETGTQTDRMYPNIVYESGITEMIFGTALGNLRSEQNIDWTFNVVSPQIVGAVADGDTIIGDGFTVNISTTCQCAGTTDYAGINTLGVVPTVAIQNLVDGFYVLNHELGLSNYIDGSDPTAIVITSIVSGTRFCGGINTTNPMSPVCTTTMSDHRNANVLVSYMTDGTTASIAQRAVSVLTMGDPADLAWVTKAMIAIVETQYSNFTLPAPIPSMVNPLLWWTTSNLLSVDPTLLEAGMETFFAVLYRSGVQRTYTTSGQDCIHNIAISGESSVAMAAYGVSTLWVLAGLQVLVTLIAICGFIPWLRSPHPIGPAVRMAKDSIYFTTLLLSTTLFSSDTLCNASPHVIWQSLDTIVRVGETFKSRDDNVVGQIAIDRPKFIAPLTDGKKYN